MLEHALFDIRIMIETADMDSVTVSHCLYNLTFELFQSVTSPTSNIKTLTHFVT